VLLYRQFEALNDLPKPFSDALERFHSPDGQHVLTLGRLQEELNAYLGVYRTGLEAAVDRANTLLPKLRRAAIPWYRLDLRLRKPKLLSLEQLGGNVAQLALDRDAQRRGVTTPNPPSAEA
jgi:hypothetical protein